MEGSKYGEFDVQTWQVEKQGGVFAWFYKIQLNQGRGTRESMPCSLIRDSEAIATPGSTTLRRCDAQVWCACGMQSANPTTPEMEELFAGFDLQQQEQF